MFPAPLLVCVRVCPPGCPPAGWCHFHSSAPPTWSVLWVQSRVRACGCVNYWCRVNPICLVACVVCVCVCPACVCVCALQLKVSTNCSLSRTDSHTLTHLWVSFFLSRAAVFFPSRLSRLLSLPKLHTPTAIFNPWTSWPALSSLCPCAVTCTTDQPARAGGRMEGHVVCLHWDREKLWTEGRSQNCCVW